MRLPLALIAALSLAAALPAGAGAAQQRVPEGFVGAMADGPIFGPQVSLDSELSRMVGSGVESVRTVFNWAVAQPYASFGDVPRDQRARFRDVGGVPTDFSAIDRIVAAATSRRLGILPVVLEAPAWAARHPGNAASPPSTPGPYAAFVGALARRYGPDGSYWAENPGVPRVPLRDWQIWNEPSFTVFWSDQPFVRDYTALLRAAHDSLKAVDAHARVILAGFPSRSWISLARLYKAGARRLFDVAAVHPFSANVNGVLRILHQDRVVMRRYGDRRKPLMVTETSWPSAKGRTDVKFGYEVTEAGQAARVKEALGRLAAARRIVHLERVYWYTWITNDQRRDYPFDFSGLLHATGSGAQPKPSLRSFRRTALGLEHCRRKGGVATRCARRG